MKTKPSELARSKFGTITQRVYSVCAASVIVLAVGVLPASAGGSVTAKSTSCATANGVKVTNPAVCKGLAYYNGKAVTFVAPTSAGSAFDVTSRAFAKEMGLYLNATVNVEDVNGANGITGMDALAAAVPNGLTIGYYNLASELGFLITNSPSVNFNFKSIPIFGAEVNNVDILATLSTSPYSSFAALKKNDSATDPVKIVTDVGSLGDSVSLMMREFGLPYTLLTAYSGTAASTTGFIRGDGPLYGSGIATLESYIEAGTVRVLAIETQALKLNRTTPLYSSLVKSPTSGALDKRYPLRTNGEKVAAKYASLIYYAVNFAAGGPSHLSPYLVTTMRATFKWAAESTPVKTQILAVGNPAGYLNPATTEVGFLKATAFAPKIGSFLGFG